MDIEFELRFGALSPAINVQLSKQGYLYDVQKVSIFQKHLKGIITLKIAGLLSESEARKCEKRLYNLIAAHIFKQNKVKIVNLKIN